MIRGISGRSKREPKTGELNTPIVLMDSSFSPDEGTGFDHTVTPYAQEWAKVRYGLMSYKKEEDTAGEVAHEFIVRDSGHSIEEGHYVVVDNKAYRIVYSMPLNERKRFVIIYAVVEGPTDKLNYTVTDDTGAELGDSTTMDDSEDIWREGF